MEKADGRKYFGETKRIVITGNEISKLREIKQSIEEHERKPLKGEDNLKKYKAAIEDSIKFLEDLQGIVLPRDRKVVYISETQVHRLIEYNDNESRFLFFASIFLGAAFGVLVNIATSENPEFTTLSSFTLIICCIVTIIFSFFYKINKSKSNEIKKLLKGEQDGNGGTSI